MSSLDKKNQAKQLRLPSLLLVAWFLSCESPSPPPMPSPVDEGDGSELGEESDGKTKKANTKGKSSDGPDLTPVNPSIGGASVGDEGMKTSVRICNTQGFYYDRYSGEKGTCTQVALAPVSCNEKGITKLLTRSQLKQFNESLTSTYDGWMIDQCIDCPPNTEGELCKSKSGDPQVGTKIFFVRPDPGSEELRGKSMFLPVRPLSDEDRTEESNSSKNKRK